MARYGTPRRTAFRPPLTVIAIVCDDSKTAVAYFDFLKREVKDRVTVRILGAPCQGANAETVIRQAGVVSQGMEADSTWALVDLEMAHDSEPLTAQLRERVQSLNINLALSQPCFEVWTLAHLIDTGSQFLNCNAVISVLRKAWKDKFEVEFPHQKAQADYSKLMPLVQVAIQNSEKHNSMNSQSWTEVWQVVRIIVSS